MYFDKNKILFRQKIEILPDVKDGHKMKKPIKVLQLSLSENIGGVETLLRNLYKQFDHDDIQFDFVTTYNSPVYKDELESGGAKIYKLPSQKRFISYRHALKKLIKENNYHIIHINKNSSADITPFIVGHELKIPVVIAHAHNTKSSVGILADTVHLFNRKRMDKYMTKAFASSEAAAEWMFSKEYCKNHDIPILKNGICISDFSYNPEKRDEIRRRLSLGDKFVIGHVGKFSKRKNHGFLIDIFAEYHKKNPNSALMLVGTGPLMADIQNKVHELGLYDSVIFMGSQENINEYYQAMDAFVLPSLAEEMPVVALEAQAAGLPVFVSDTVDHELEITDSVKWLSLEQPASIWADIILNVCDCFERKSQDEAIKQAGYDIADTAAALSEVYHSIDNLED